MQWKELGAKTAGNQRIFSISNILHFVRRFWVVFGEYDLAVWVIVGPFSLFWMVLAVFRSFLPLRVLVSIRFHHQAVPCNIFYLSIKQYCIVSVLQVCVGIIRFRSLFRYLKILWQGPCRRASFSCCRYISRDIDETDNSSSSVIYKIVCAFGFQEKKAARRRLSPKRLFVCQWYGRQAQKEGNEERTHCPIMFHDRNAINWHKFITADDFVQTNVLGDPVGLCFCFRVASLRYKSYIRQKCSLLTLFCPILVGIQVL